MEGRSFQQMTGSEAFEKCKTMAMVKRSKKKDQKDT